jgi:tetratricopeptide (TPR) repeat protein
MPTFGDYETVGDPVEITDETGHVSTIWKARKVGSRDSRVYAVKRYSPHRRQAGTGPPEGTLDRDRGLEFLEGIKQLKKAHRDGVRGLVPVHEFGLADEGAWYVTDYYQRGALKGWIAKKGAVDSAGLRNVVYSVVSVCLALKRSRSYGHGNLKATNVFLLGKSRPLRQTLHVADPYPAGSLQLAKLEGDDRLAVGGMLQETIEEQDRIAIGELLLQLVRKRLIAGDRDYDWPVRPSPDWENLGRDGKRWLDLCNQLLNRKTLEGKISLEALAKEFRPNPVVAKLPLIMAVIGVTSLVGAVVYFVGANLAERRQEAFTKHFQSATNSLEAKDLVAARREINLAIDRKPNDQAAVLWKEKIETEVKSKCATLAHEAGTEFDAGHLDEAMQRLTNALALNPEGSIANETRKLINTYQAGQAALDRKDYAQAREQAGQVLASRANNAPAKTLDRQAEEGRQKVPPTISRHPVDLPLTAGGGGSFSVEATGATPLSYQWKREGAMLPGATNPMLNLPPTATSSAGQFRYTCVVSNAGGASTSRVATLTVKAGGPPPKPPPVEVARPTIDSNPTNLIVSVGDGGRFFVKATGPSPLTYQWQRDGRLLAGETNETLNLTAQATGSAGQYKYTCLVSNVGGASTSRVATLTVTKKKQTIQFGEIPSQTVGGSPYRLTAQADSGLSITYESSDTQVARVTNNLVTILKAGTTTITARQPGNAIYEPAEPVSRTLTVSPAPISVQPSEITAQPQSLTNEPGTLAEFKVQARGSPPFNYQWRKGIGNLSDGGRVAGATTDALSLTGVSSNDVGNYSVVVSNAVNVVTSAPAWLMVIARQSPPPETPLPIIHAPTNFFGMDFVWIPNIAGGNGAYVAKTELSQAQSKRLGNLELRPEQFPKNSPNYAANLTFDQAKDLCDKLSKEDVGIPGRFKLPTKEDFLIYSETKGLSSTDDPKFAELKSKFQEVDAVINYDNKQRSPVPVTEGKGNRFELLNVLGNAWEWCVESDATSNVYAPAGFASSSEGRGPSAKLFSPKLDGERFPIALRLMFVPNN